MADASEALTTEPKLCQRQMGHWSKPHTCGRAIHAAPKYDSEPVCLMHSSDPEKSIEEFVAEFQRILDDAENGINTANFGGFVFPLSRFLVWDFKTPCTFHKAKFLQDADFFSATFAQAVDFSLAEFTQKADFSSATFTKQSSFASAVFQQDADFAVANFMQETNFSAAQFKQKVGFSTATFSQNADFSRAEFSQDADFTDAEFSQGARFFAATISGGMQFRETKFFAEGPQGASLALANAKLTCPEKVAFYKTDLSGAIFFNTDVSHVDFTLVQWHRRGKSGRFGLFDELVKLDSDTLDLMSLPESRDERDYGLIAATYQQLKRNYDAKGDYWTAGHFHYGEMEMLRLHSRFEWKPLRWMAQHMSLTALYKYGSEYGESVTRPLLWLVAMAVLFALLFPLAGLEVNASPGEQGLNGRQVNYWNARQFFLDHDSENPVPKWIRRVTRDHAALPLLVHSEMTALSVAGFQKELRYSPAYPGGRALGLLEVLLTTTLGGLFLLAIRRQYKRS